MTCPYGRGGFVPFRFLLDLGPLAGLDFFGWLRRPIIKDKFLRAEDWPISQIRNKADRPGPGSGQQNGMRTLMDRHQEVHAVVPT